MHAQLAVPLPYFLTADEFGFVRVGGTRVSLVDIVSLYNKGYSAGMLAERFPTVSLAAVHHVIAFYLDHSDGVDAYVGAEVAHADRLAADHVPNEKMVSLRERVRTARSTRVKAAHAP